MAYTAYQTLPSVPTLVPLTGTNVVYMPMEPVTFTPTPMPQQPLSEEEQLRGEIPKTCGRCGSLYNRAEDTETACAHHPGTFRDGKLAFWDCCKALFSSAPPCTRVPHREAEFASDQLRKYLYMTAQNEHKRTVNASMMPGAIDTTLGPTKKRIVKADNMPKDGVVIHTILPTDTLEGVALKYDISKAELFKANRGLSASSFPAFRKIVVPVGDAEVLLETGLSAEQKKALEEERLRCKFAKQFRVSSEEAAAYLSSHNYDYELASKDYAEDMAFESSMTAAPSVIFSSRSTKFPAVKISK
jgi:LysM repeat protein